MCGSEGESEACIERGLYAARLDMVRVHDVLAGERARRYGECGTATDSNRMKPFLKLTAPQHLFSSRWNDQH